MDSKPAPFKPIAAIEQMLHEQGISSFEPRVLVQLLEFMNKYIHDVLRETQLLAQHVQRKNGAATVDDLRLALDFRSTSTFVDPPSLEFLLDMAKPINAEPLPAVPERYGLRLPIDKYCQLSKNYQLDLEGMIQKSKELRQQELSRPVELSAAEQQQQADAIQRANMQAFIQPAKVAKPLGMDEEYD